MVSFTLIDNFFARHAMYIEHEVRKTDQNVEINFPTQELSFDWIKDTPPIVIAIVSLINLILLNRKLKKEKSKHVNMKDDNRAKLEVLFTEKSLNNLQNISVEKVIVDLSIQNNSYSFSVYKSNNDIHIKYESSE